MNDIMGKNKEKIVSKKSVIPRREINNKISFF